MIHHSLARFPQRAGHITYCQDPAKHTAPLLEAVAARGLRLQDVSFHVPGHKRGRGVHPKFQQLVDDGLLRYDLTEIKGLDYLSSPTGAIAEAQRLAAAAFGADATWFLVNGCSGGIHAAVMASAGPGDTMLVARNCHLSAFSAMVLSGCSPLWLQPEVDPVHGIAHGVTPDELRRSFAEAERLGRRVTAVLVVSPTYYGAASHLTELASISHAHGAALLVDEAHGAHFALCRTSSAQQQEGAACPPSALQCGADAAMQSTHKVLSAMSQGAMLHTVGARVDGGRVSRALQVLQSSSPSYLLLASLDAARLLAQQPGAWDTPLATAQAIRDGLQHVAGVSVLALGGAGGGGGTTSVAGYDPLRLTVNVTGLRCSGFDAAEWLEDEHSVVPELATQRLVVFAMGPGTVAADGASLLTAFQALAATCQRNAVTGAGIGAAVDPVASGTDRQDAEAHCGGGCAEEAVPEQRLSPRDAYFAPSVRLPRAQCIGRVSAELLCPYPPGVPLLFPGEVVTPGVLDLLDACRRAGGTITGAADGTLETLLVVL